MNLLRKLFKKNEEDEKRDVEEILIKFVDTDEFCNQSKKIENRGKFGIDYLRIPNIRDLRKGLKNLQNEIKERIREFQEVDKVEIYLASFRVACPKLEKAIENLDIKFFFDYQEASYDFKVWQDKIDEIKENLRSRFDKVVFLEMPSFENYEIRNLMDQ